MSTEETAAEIHEALPVLMASYLVIGEDQNGVQIARFACPDEESRKKINAILTAIVLAGGLPPPAGAGRSAPWMQN